MFICPDLKCECIEDHSDDTCVAFKRGIQTVIPNLEILQYVCDDDLKIDLTQITFPLIITLDVGICSKYDQMITDCGLINTLESYSQEEEING